MLNLSYTLRYQAPTPILFLSKLKLLNQRVLSGIGKVPKELTFIIERNIWSYIAKNGRECGEVSLRCWNRAFQTPLRPIIEMLTIETLRRRIALQTWWTVPFLSHPGCSRQRKR